MSYIIQLAFDSTKMNCLCSPQEAVKAAERMGLGFDDHGHFVKKQNVTIGPRNSCMPRVKEKTLEGRISHVSSIEFDCLHLSI